ncbi:MAG: S8 family serine peptidase [Sphingomonas phyllosphaerae]
MTEEMARQDGGRMTVLIEMRVQSGTPGILAMESARGLGGPPVEIDPSFQPVPGAAPAGIAAAGMGAEDTTYTVRGTIDADQIEALRAQPDVVAVWSDAPIDHFGTDEVDGPGNDSSFAPGDCPIPPCDCASNVPKGTIADVVAYLKINEVWAQGTKGAGIAIGIVDGGITAAGRTIRNSDTTHPDWPNKLIPQVTKGWPVADWGTTGASWGWHGNMTATDALGMAPEAEIYDMRISDGESVGQALQAYQWALNLFKSTGKPQILSNSWGMWQKAWAPDYATNPDHPFTKKVVECIDAGMIVLFAAGNCGLTCGGTKCAADKGPGKDIWGANGHEKVITVGAVNRLEQFVGYSSQGPAALHPQKPDICGITHFTGFFGSDSGTSAACPVVAGLVALMKQAKPSATQAKIKASLKATAKNIGPGGWDQHSGSGIVQGKAAVAHIKGNVLTGIIADRITSPTSDRITIVTSDTITGSINDTITRPIIDRIATSPVTDRITIVTADRGTIGAIDRPTTSISGDVGPRIPIDPGRPGQEFGANGSGRGPSPFVLQHPHEATDTPFGDDAADGGPEAAEYAAIIESYEAQLQQCNETAHELSETIAQAQAQLAEVTSEFDAVAASYSELVAAYGQRPTP